MRDLINDAGRYHFNPSVSISDIIDIKIFKVNISNYLTIQATSQQDNKFINEVKTNTTILLEKKLVV